MARFIKGHKQAKGGKRPGAGRPTKAELAEKEAMLNIWEKKLEEKAEMIIDRYLAEALKDNKVLIDVMKKMIPDAKQEIEIQGRHMVIINTFDANAERRRKQLEPPNH